MENSYVDLDQIQPPSNMASIVSLNSSTSLTENERIKRSFRLTDSILDAESSFQDLEQVQPPSAMDSILSLTCSSDDKKKPNIKEGSLLENVKPPADMEDLLDLENSIMSVASLSSEVADSVEDVTLEAATPPQQRKVTAKQRRELGKHRFNTYVIKPEENKETQREDELGTDEIKEKLKEKITPKQRRQADRERFRTRTIHDVPQQAERLSSVESGETSPVESPDSTSDDPPPRPVVVKPPEVKTVRGGGKSSIPVVRSPIKTPTPTGTKKKAVGVTAPLQRQGTFTKDEPSSNIPVPVKKTASPLKKTPASKSSGSVAGRGRAASLPTKTGCGVRVSVSNQSLKSACSEQGSGTRWHSNSSLNTTQTKKEATSKIGNLWKKVEENKKKQQQSKDTRVWIPPEPRNKQVT